MYRNTGPTKRQKELAREEKKREKAEKKEQRAKEKSTRSLEDGEDPDIAGIVPGPQPLAIDELAPMPANGDAGAGKK